MKIIDLGHRSFISTWALQHELLAKRIDNRIPDTLLLVEHPPVITKGRGASDRDILSRRFPLFEIERGGKATYHGPGQIVGYPIVDLGPLRRIKAFVCHLEEVLIRSLHHFDIAAERKEGATGVWTRGKKIASIGIAVKKNVSYHGFSLNVNTDLSHYGSILPCGFESSVITSMKEILNCSIDISQVRQEIARQI
ncbi:MAG: lipoyl(octanoyl) transferase LipB [Deltaproteobacteria bacterium]